jgi:hypothetical protein
VQAVGLGVEGQPGRGFQRGEEGGKLCVGINHAENILAGGKRGSENGRRVTVFKKTSGLI